MRRRCTFDPGSAVIIVAIFSNLFSASFSISPSSIWDNSPRPPLRPKQIALETVFELDDVNHASVNGDYCSFLLQAENIDVNSNSEKVSKVEGQLSAALLELEQSRDQLRLLTESMPFKGVDTNELENLRTENQSIRDR